MESEQISKKDLLELTGISYGQLYRWKRKGLIPEDWFIRKATFTGQETFFPKEEILARVGKIKNMKEDLSLDDIAGKFSPFPAELKISREDAIAKKIVSERVLEHYHRELAAREDFSFEETFVLYMTNKLVESGDLNVDEVSDAVKTLREGYPRFEGKACELLVVRKLGVAFAILASPTLPPVLDSSSKTIVRMNLSTCMEELKLIM